MLANGDIQSPQEAKRVLEVTGADGIMIGRAAQGKPWLFREIAHYLATGEYIAAPDAPEMAAVLTEQLEGLYDLYGAEHGARIARKHIGWTVRGLRGGEEFRRAVNAVVDAETQLRAVCDYFERLACDDAPHFEERLAA